MDSHSHWHKCQLDQTTEIKGQDNYLSKLVEKSENTYSISMLYIKYRQNVSERFYKTRFSADQYKDPTWTI